MIFNKATKDQKFYLAFKHKQNPYSNKSIFKTIHMIMKCIYILEQVAIMAQDQYLN